MAEIKEILYSEEEQWNMDIPDAKEIKEKIRIAEDKQLRELVKDAIKQMIETHSCSIKINVERNFTHEAIRKIQDKLRKKGYNCYTTNLNDNGLSKSFRQKTKEIIIEISHYTDDIPF